MIQISVYPGRGTSYLYVYGPRIMDQEYVAHMSGYFRFVPSIHVFTKCKLNFGKYILRQTFQQNLAHAWLCT